MDNGAFFATFIVNISIFVIATYILLRLRKKEKIGKLIANIAVIPSAIFSVLISVFVVPKPLVSLFEIIGFEQYYGHGYFAFVIIYNFALGVALLIIGLVLINWKFKDANVDKNTIT